MSRARRAIGGGVVGASVIACAVTIGLWVLSYGHGYAIMYAHPPPTDATSPARTWRAGCGLGRVTLELDEVWGRSGTAESVPAGWSHLSYQSSAADDGLVTVLFRHFSFDAGEQSFAPGTGGWLIRYVCVPIWSMTAGTLVLPTLWLVRWRRGRRRAAGFPVGPVAVARVD